MTEHQPSITIAEDSDTLLILTVGISTIAAQEQCSTATEEKSIASRLMNHDIERHYQCAAAHNEVLAIGVDVWGILFSLCRTRTFVVFKRK
jgi:hypothetical protein